MNKQSLQRLVIACGGTGGHFYPGLSIARECKSQGGKVTLFLSGKHSVNQAKTAAQYGIDSVLIPSSPRIMSPRGIYVFLRDLFVGTLRARKHFRIIKPNAFLAMGSFASVPSALAARSRNIPVFLHEGNARIGKANSLLSRFSKRLMVAFPSVNPNMSRSEIIETGMPVRPELHNKAMTKEEAITKLNQKHRCDLSAEKPTILVFGGSQGTQIFNETLPPVVASHGNNKLQIIHLTGKNKLGGVETLYGIECKNVLLLESTPDMELMFNAADTVICRSGGSTLAELMIFGKYSVLVPYPWSADGHQYDNANHLSTNGSAELVTNDDFTSEFCSTLVKSILENPDKFAVAGEKNKALAKPEATRLILQLIEETI